MKPLFVGIVGGSGSGKSTVARNIAAQLGTASVAFLDMDGYYRDLSALPFDERRRFNWDHPDAVDWELLLAQLTALRDGTPIEKPVYDFVTHTRSAQSVRVPAADVVVVDGILLFTDSGVRDLFDVRIFVDTDADLRLVRRIRRDTAERGRPLEEVLQQYLDTVQPMHQQFVEPSKRFADVIVPEGGHNAVATDMIVAAIQRRLGLSQSASAVRAPGAGANF